MNLLLSVSSLAAAYEAYAAMLVASAGRHVSDDLVVPENITLIYLPRYSPELNANEKLWQLMRINIFSHRLFTDIDDIIDACCRARN